MAKNLSIRGDFHTASMKELMTHNPMPTETYSKIQGQRRKARQLVDSLQDQRYYQHQNEFLLASGK